MLQLAARGGGGGLVGGPALSLWPIGRLLALLARRYGYNGERSSARFSDLCVAVYTECLGAFTVPQNAQLLLLYVMLEMVVSGRVSQRRPSSERYGPIAG